MHSDESVAAVGRRPQAGDVRAAAGPTMRTIVASVIGNGLEWFDFFAYTMLAETVAAAFFPAGTPGMGLVLTFAAFAIGFVARPIGGLMFGLSADRKGRRRVLAPIMGMMSIASLLVALTPGYGRIGLAAPLLVVIARILQGLSVGGEFAGSATYLVECAPRGRQIATSSFQMSGQSLGLLAASLSILALEQLMPAAAFTDWGWRIPFAAGAVIGPVGLYMRHHLADSPEFAAARARGLPETSVLSRLRPHLGSIVCGVGLVAMGASIGYLWELFLPGYVVHEIGLPRQDAVLVTTVTSIVTAITFASGGRLGQRIGSYRLGITATVLFGLTSWPLFHWLTAAPDFTRLLTAEIVASVFLGLIAGCHPGQVAMLFPVTVRATGVALSYNTAVLLFGGLAPMTVSWLLLETRDVMVPALFEIVVAVISLSLIAVSGPAIRTAKAREAAGPDLSSQPAAS